MINLRETNSTPPSSSRYAEVALPLPMSRSFTYEVPSRLSGRIFVGCRVQVPFGRRVLSGIVVDLHADTDISGIKPIRDIQDTFVPTDLLKLADWITAYYGCSQGETLQAVLPPSFKRAKNRRQLGGTVTLVENPTSVDWISRAEGRLSRSKKQLAVFRALVLAGGSASYGDLAANWGATRPVMDGLLQKGLVRVDDASPASPLASVDGVIERLTDEQETVLKAVVSAVDSGMFVPILLQGVTGSGKTEVYLRSIRHALSRGAGSIVLVPEIGLLPQATERYRRVLGDDVAIIHSRLTGPERYDIWRSVAEGSCRVVVGPRSAIFSPVRNLRLIVVDEEQDDSYKQDDKPRYHARNVALIRGQQNGLTVVLGSATPSAESLRCAVDGKYRRLRLSRRVGGVPMPNVDIVDMRAGQGPAALISDRLAVELESCVRAGGQAIVFLNKRGHARYVQCSACGWVAQCGECDISLTYHRIDSRIKCHLCGYHVRAPERCPECGAPRLRYAGVGTQRVELDLAALLPGVGVLRMDADSTGGKQGHRRVLEAFGSGRYSILLGTQMVTKGHHFPRVQLVGVLSAEDSLNFPDFRSVERTFQTLTQVAGRAGRSNAPGRVVVQTYAPDHYIFDYLVRHDYEGFMDEELRLRRQLLYPPFTRLVLAAGTCRDPDLLHRAMSGLAEAIRSRYADVKVLGPAPPPVARVKGRFREQILLKGTLRNDAKREILGAFKDQAARLGAARALDFRWDVDPESFL